MIKGKWGFIDKSGKLVLPAKFDYALDFCESVARVTIGEFNGKHGFIVNGNYVLEPKFLPMG
jgi:hypothetical protein